MKLMISKNISTPGILIVQEIRGWHLCRHRWHSPRNFGLARVSLGYFFFGFAACLNFGAGTCFFHSPALEKNDQVLPILLLILIFLPIHSNKCTIYSCLYDAKEIFATSCFGLEIPFLVLSILQVCTKSNTMTRPGSNKNDGWITSSMWRTASRGPKTKDQS